MFPHKLKVILDCRQIELTLVHLRSEPNLALLLLREVHAVLVNVRVDALRFIVEQEPAQDALPGHVRLVGLLSDRLQEEFEARLQFAQTRQTQVRHHVVDHDELLVRDAPLVDHLQNSGEVGVPR